MNNIKFEKRVDKWQNYRSQIEADSTKEWLNDKNIKSIINAVNSIDKNILKDIDEEKIELVEVSLINGSNEKVQNTYQSLKFNIPSFNQDYLQNIEDEYKNIQAIKNSNYILDANDTILIDNLPIYKEFQNNDIHNIDSYFVSLGNEIQFFPKVAKEKTIKIDETIERTRSKQNLKKIEKKSFKDSFNFKWVFMTSFTLIAIFFILVILVVVLMLVLKGNF